jgi:lysophospholipase L1-like esterase
MTGPASRWRFLVVGAWAAYLAFVVFVVLGLLLHSSRNPELLGYSYAELATMGTVAGLLLAPPVLLHLLLSRLGRRQAFLALIPLVTLCILAWLVFGARYYLKQSYSFDPFLQAAGTPVPDADRGDELRVLALGGSTTEGGILALEDRYPSLLADELRRRLGRSVEVHNAGKVWWTTKHSLINYVTDGRRWNADVVVVMHAINDLYRSCSPEALAVGDYDARWSHFYGPAIRAARPPTFVGALTAPLRNRVDSRWYDEERFREVDFPLAYYQSLPDFERHLRALVGYIRSDAAQPVLLTQPTLLSGELSEEQRRQLEFGQVFCARRISDWDIEVPSPQSLARAMQAYNDVTRRVAREEDVPLVDLARAVPSTLEYFVDDVHHTPRATGLISKEVAEVLVPMLASSAKGAEENGDLDSRP